MEAVHCSETSVSTSKTTQRHKPEDHDPLCVIRLRMKGCLVHVKSPRNLCVTLNLNCYINLLHVHIWAYFTEFCVPFFADFRLFFWKRVCGRNWGQRVPNFDHPTFFNLLKNETKWKCFQKYRLEYRSATINERSIYVVSFHFHVTAAVKFDLFKIGTKLGTLPSAYLSVIKLIRKL